MNPLLFQQGIQTVDKAVIAFIRLEAFSLKSSHMRSRSAEIDVDKSRNV